MIKLLLEKKKKNMFGTLIFFIVLKSLVYEDFEKKEAFKSTSLLWNRAVTQGHILLSGTHHTTVWKGF